MSRSDRLISEISGGGWDELNGLAAQHTGDRSNQERRIGARAGKYHQLFRSPLGREVLDDLVGCTIDKPGWRWDLTDPQAIMAYGLHSEGQKSVVQMILNILAEVEQSIRAEMAQAEIADEGEDR